MSRYRRKPTEVEAFKFTGNYDDTQHPVWIGEALASGTCYLLHPDTKKAKMMIKHSSGLLAARLGDYIVNGTIPGDIYPASAEAFESTYEKLQE